jgi:glycine betaine/proline transport system substrate-binding protein
MSLRRLLKLLFAGALALVVSTAVAAKETIKIGWTAWSDAEFVTKLAKRILEDRMDYDVELLQTDIAPQYQGLATGRSRASQDFRSQHGVVLDSGQRRAGTV